MTQAIKGYSYREPAFTSSGPTASGNSVPTDFFNSNPDQGDAAEMLRKLKEKIASSGNTPATLEEFLDLQEKMADATIKQQEARKLYDQDLFALSKHIAEFSRTDSPIAKVVAEKLTEKLKELGLSTPAF
jgi:hypothetical protein